MRIGSLLSAWGRQRRGPAPLAPSGAGPLALKVGYLSAMDVFRDLPKSEIHRLAETTTMVTVSKGRVIYRPGESNAALLLLKKGRVQIVRESADGRRLVLATLGAETFFGEMAEMFPSRWFHVGADEVPKDAWGSSPLANTMRWIIRLLRFRDEFRRPAPRAAPRPARRCLSLPAPAARPFRRDGMHGLRRCPGLR